MEPDDKDDVTPFATGDDTVAFDPDSAPAAPDTRDLNDKFEVLGLIGRGGMGAVYKVRHRELDHVRAVKVLTEQPTPEWVERLRREAAIGTQLAHPSIATIYDLEKLPGGRLAIVMEYLEGRDLQRQVEVEGRLDAHQLPGLFEDVADALDRMHAAGVIHRDIKPANLFLCDDGSLRLLDFGVSQQLGDVSRLTRTGAAVGTPAFMSPEQFGREEVGPPSDIYSLGATLYFCVTGQLPFQANTMPELLARVLNGERPRAEEVREDLPPHVGDSLALAMDRQPARRFASAGALVAALGAQGADVSAVRSRSDGPASKASIEPTSDPSSLPPTASTVVRAPVRRPPPSPDPSTRSRTALLAVALLVALLCLWGLWTWKHAPAPRDDGADPSRPAVSDARFGGTLRLGTTTKILPTDPLETVVEELASIYPLLYDTLVEEDWTGTIQPSLAVSWESHDDHRRYLFQLRKDVLFHDPPTVVDGPGRALEAEDVRRSLERVFLSIARDEQRQTSHVPPVVGTEDVLDGRDDRLAGVRVVNEQTVEVLFTRPAPTFCHSLARPEWSIFAASALPPVGGEGSDFQPLGTGPFRVQEQSAAGLVLRRHPGTWHRDAQERTLPYPDRVEILPFRDATMARTALVEGRIDLVIHPGRNVINETFDLEDRKVVMAPGWESFQVGAYLDDSVREIYLLLVDRHSSHPVIGDPRLRSALAAAIQRDELIRRSTVAASGPLGEGMLGYEVAAQPDRGLASALLEQAGYPGGEGLPPLSLCGLDGQDDELATIAAHLQQVGLRAEVRFVEYETWMRHLDEGGCDLLDARFHAPTVNDDPSDAILRMISQVDLPARDDTVAPLMEELQETGVRERRAEILNELASALTEDTMIIFITHRRPTWPFYNYLAGPRVGGLADPATGFMNPIRHRMRELWVREGDTSPLKQDKVEGRSAP